MCRPAQSPLPGAGFPARQASSSEALSPPQEQIMKKPPSPRTPKHSRVLPARSVSPRKALQQPRLGAAHSSEALSPQRSEPGSPTRAGRAEQAVPPIFQSPRKRPPSDAAGDGSAPGISARYALLLHGTPLMASMSETFLHASSLSGIPNLDST